MFSVVPTEIAKQNISGFWNSVITITVVMGILFSIVFAVYYLAYYLSLNVRRVLTNSVHQQYISSRMYYRINCIDRYIDNP